MNQFTYFAWHERRRAPSGEPGGREVDYSDRFQDRRGDSYDPDGLFPGRFRDFLEVIPAVAAAAAIVQLEDVSA